MRFFEFNQNNSGGSFVFDRERGITGHVIVEARTSEEADKRAEGIGLYFDGCADGRDCQCCGDRWYPAWGKGESEPLVHDVPAATSTSMWFKNGDHVCVHYADGRIEWPARTSHHEEPSP